MKNTNTVFHLSFPQRQVVCEAITEGIKHSTNQITALSAKPSDEALSVLPMWQEHRLNLASALSALSESAFRPVSMNELMWLSVGKACNRYYKQQQLEIPIQPALVNRLNFLADVITQISNRFSTYKTA